MSNVCLMNSLRREEASSQMISNRVMGALRRVYGRRLAQFLLVSRTHLAKVYLRS